MLYFIQIQSIAIAMSSRLNKRLIWKFIKQIWFYQKTKIHIQNAIEMNLRKFETFKGNVHCMA